MREQVGRRCDIRRESGEDSFAGCELVSLLASFIRIPGSNARQRQCLTDYLSAVRKCGGSIFVLEPMPGADSRTRIMRARERKMRVGGEIPVADRDERRRLRMKRQVRNPIAIDLGSGRARPVGP